MQTNLAEKREVIYIDSFKKEEIKLRVAAYVRVSSNSDEQLNSFATQLTYYKHMIAEHKDWELVEVYCDEAVSGAKTDKRNDFKRMIDDCNRGKIDRIFTKSISRFARNTNDTLSAVRKLKELGISIKFEKENIDTANLEGETLLTIYASFAQEELISISDNTKRGNRMRMKNGTYVPSTVPYGYRLIDRKFTIHQQESKIVKRIFSEYLAGKGLYTISKELIRDGIPTPTDGERWREHTISGILKNERYKGDMLLQKTYSPDVFPLKKVKNKGEMPKYYVKNHHEGIISSTDFDMVQSILKERYSSGISKGEYPLARKIKCSNCQSTFRRVITGGKTYWCCYNHNKGKEYCPVVQISEEEIYAAFIRMYHKLHDNYEYILLPMISQLQSLRDNGYRENENIEQLNKEIAKLSEQSHTLSTLVNQGVLDSAIFISKRDELNQKISKLRNEKSLYLGDIKDKTLEQTEELVAILEESQEVLQDFDENIFDDIVEKIIAYEDRTIGFYLINGIECEEKVSKARR